MIANKYKLNKKVLYTSGMIGIWKALQLYDGTTAFNTYAYYRVRGEMLDQIREDSPVPRSKVKKLSVLNETTLGEDFEINALVGSSKLQPENIIERELKTQEVKNHVGNLQGKVKYVICDYLNEVLVKDTAKKLAISESRVCQHRKAGKEYIRSKMEA